MDLSSILGYNLASRYMNELSDSGRALFDGIDRLVAECNTAGYTRRATDTPGKNSSLYEMTAPILAILSTLKCVDTASVAESPPTAEFRQTMARIFPILDDVDRAMKAVDGPGSPEQKLESMRTGVELIRRKLISACIGILQDKLD